MEAQQLFDDLIHYLSRRGLLTKFLIGGIIHTEMLVILKKVVGKKRISNAEIRWRGVPNPDLTTFWKSMQNFLDGTPGRAIVLGLQGYHDHWTVIAMIYLSAFGSVAAFLLYFKLAQRQGPARAGLMGMVIPVIALGVSAVLEDWRPTPIAGLGIALCLGGLWSATRRAAAN